jgi:hypothetical protein
VETIMSAGEMERIISRAVRTLVDTRVRAPQPTDVTRVPLRLRQAEDVAALLLWFKKLCADEGWRQRFLSGELQLAIELAPAGNAVATHSRTAAGAPAIAPVEVPRRAVVLNEDVVTEAILRRHAKRNDVIALSARAVVTPSARDYARAAGIRVERKP